MRPPGEINARAADSASWLIPCSKGSATTILSYMMIFHNLLGLPNFLLIPSYAGDVWIENVCDAAHNIVKKKRRPNLWGASFLEQKFASIG
ncbi:hypothetical protein OCA8868_01126 [Octadecabacter ascidiaceicola]|uniref:Uncharacterized protein n=1 Tax=Octadecabacter ascidiaceicola TaxID=1655543 RepID=A0A238K372_9RHOB|nr:hypothetical protein OCA8868_01126 [Octadecabacter ascidiaceicola]